jgi:hypothetical protein
VDEVRMARLSAALRSDTMSTLSPGKPTLS